MSIASLLTKLKTDLEAAYAALEDKGATLPDDCNYENLADTIATISGGGFGRPSKLVEACSKNQVVTSTKGILVWYTNTSAGSKCTVAFDEAGGKIVGKLDYTSTNPTTSDISTTVQTCAANDTITAALTGFLIPNSGGTVTFTAPSSSYTNYRAVVW